MSAATRGDRLLESAAPAPPPPDVVRDQLRLAVGVGQMAYGVLRLRRSRVGWYHVVLGGRQVVQARLDGAGLFSPAADTAVDGIHVATMLGVALARRRPAPQALLGAAHAARGRPSTVGSLPGPAGASADATGRRLTPAAVRRTHAGRSARPTTRPTATSAKAHTSPQPATDVVRGRRGRGPGRRRRRA